MNKIKATKIQPARSRMAYFEGIVLLSAALGTTCSFTEMEIRMLNDKIQI